ncbi:acetyltransferase [Salipiger aestuarii]|uniref:GNAT family N-acetyltransferase n=1 Tax=Salipiger aestuarii TaxID=568098 RepID=UPI00123908E0|nr:GNAT family N-acetyltransferase [Salipiger aestuarii]KAA8609677.1 acetyltransferase [Salipiger aestuarii]
MIRELDAAGAAAHLPDLADTLHACVEDGASVGFVMPFSPTGAEAFFRDSVLPSLARGGRVIWGAFDAGLLVGTVQLDLEMMPNQRHRAEVCKLLVRPSHRRRGIARALMQALLMRADAADRTLVTLDTRSGDGAQALYAACGFDVAGEIPGFALAPDGSDRRDATTYMYRNAPARAAP